MVLDCFREVVVVDFEFLATPATGRSPVCLVAHELRSGRRFRVWQDQFGPVPPYATGPDVLFVAYYASAELGCYRVLGWPMPERILDLFTEFRARTNGLGTPAGNGLLGALTYFGLDGIGAGEKEDMRALILGGGPWSEDERVAILNYCESDVLALERLLPAMLPGIDLPRALVRGRYMAAASAMEHAGTPIDVDMLALFSAPLDGYPGPTHCRYRRRLRRVRWPHLQELNALPPGWWPTTSPGRCLTVAPSISVTTPSDNRRALIRRCRRYANCGHHSRTCGSTTWQSARTVGIGRSCPRSDRARDAISLQIPSLYLGRPYGCAV